MAGKHTGADEASASIGPNYIPGGKIDKAFAEGWNGNPATNPHPSGSPANLAWTAGNEAAQGYEAGTGTGAGYTPPGITVPDEDLQSNCAGVWTCDTRAEPGDDYPAPSFDANGGGAGVGTVTFGPPTTSGAATISDDVGGAGISNGVSYTVTLGGLAAGTVQISLGGGTLVTFTGAGLSQTVVAGATQAILIGAGDGLFGYPTGAGTPVVTSPITIAAA